LTTEDLARHGVEGQAGVMVRVLTLADTHTTAAAAGSLIDRLRPQLERADMILHAGDVTGQGVLERLAEFAELHAVLGNNDTGLDLPERLTVVVAGRTISMVHDSGQAKGRGARLRRWFPGSDLVVFGHSHLPWHEVDVRADGHRQHHVNPGSATRRRMAPACTVAWVTLEPGRVVDVRHQPV
jgi:putative phosphoesterase